MISVNCSANSWGEMGCRLGGKDWDPSFGQLLGAQQGKACELPAWASKPRGHQEGAKVMGLEL